MAPKYIGSLSYQLMVCALEHLPETQLGPAGVAIRDSLPK